MQDWIAQFLQQEEAAGSLSPDHCQRAAATGVPPSQRVRDSATTWWWWGCAVRRAAANPPPLQRWWRSCSSDDLPAVPLSIDDFYLPRAERA